MHYSHWLLPTFLLVIELAAVVAASIRVARRLQVGPGAILEKTTYAFTGALIQVVLVTQLTGIIGILSRYWVFALQLVLAAAILLLVKPAPPSPRQWNGNPTGKLSAVTPRQWAVVVTALVAVGFLALAVILSVTRATSDSDTLQYHLPNLAFWLQHRSIRQLPYSQPGFFTNAYPSNGELTALWLVLPFHSDLLAFVMPTLFSALCVLSVAVLAKKLGAQAWAGAAAGLVVMASPLVTFSQIDSVLTDAAGVAGLVVGLISAIEARDAKTPWHWFAFGGLALGLSVGAKDTAVLPGIAIIIIFVALARGGSRLLSLGLSTLGTFLLTGFWYIRDWVLLGNPIFPKSLKIGSHVIWSGPTKSPLLQYQTSMLSQILHGHSTPVDTWGHWLGQLVGPVLILVIVGIVGGVIASIAKHRPAMIVVTLVALFACVAYLATPYTGGGPSGNAVLIAAQIRYALPAFCFAAALAAAVVPQWLSGVLGALLLAFDAFKLHKLNPARPELRPGPKFQIIAVAVAVIVVAVGTLVSERGLHTLWRAAPARLSSATTGAERRRPVLGWVGIVVLVGACTLAGAGVFHTLRGPSSADPLGEALAAAGQPNGTAVLVGSAEIVPLLGPHLANQIIIVGATGLDHTIPVSTPAALDRAIQAARPAVLIVEPVGSDGRPAGWSPPRGWRSYLTTDSGTLLIRS